MPPLIDSVLSSMNIHNHSPTKLLTARRKVKFARGEEISAGCSLHVEMWAFYSAAGVPKKNEDGESGGSWVVGGGLE